MSALTGTAGPYHTGLISFGTRLEVSKIMTGSFMVSSRIDPYSACPSGKLEALEAKLMMSSEI